LVDFGVLTLTKAGRRVRKLASERHIFSLRLKLRTNVEFSQLLKDCRIEGFIFFYDFFAREALTDIPRLAQIYCKLAYTAIVEFPS